MVIPIVMQSSNHNLSHQTLPNGNSILPPTDTGASARSKMLSGAGNKGLDAVGINCFGQGWSLRRVCVPLHIQMHPQFVVGDKENSVRLDLVRWEQNLQTLQLGNLENSRI